MCHFFEMMSPSHPLETMAGINRSMNEDPRHVQDEVDLVFVAPFRER